MPGELRQSESGKWTISAICHTYNSSDLKIPAKYTYDGKSVLFSATTTPMDIETEWHTEPGVAILVRSIAREYVDVSVKEGENWKIYKGYDDFNKTNPVVPLVVITGITLEDLTWVTDIPATGGTATNVNCSYRVIAHYSDGHTEEVSTTVSGSKTVGASTIEERHTAGTLTLSATYGAYTATKDVTIWQEAFVPILAASCDNTNPASQQTTTTLRVTGNIPWTASSEQRWITITNPAGTGDATRTVTYDTNMGAQRTATITVTTGGTGGGSPVNIQVTQSGGEVKPAPSINSVEITTTSYDPPVNPLSIHNALQRSLICSFTTDGPALPGSYAADGTITVNIQSSLYPFNVTRWNGGTGANEGDNLYIVNTVTNNYMTAPKDGSGYETTSGQRLAIREGDGIEITNTKPFTGITILNSINHQWLSGSFSYTDDSGSHSNSLPTTYGDTREYPGMKTPVVITSINATIKLPEGGSGSIYFQNVDGSAHGSLQVPRVSWGGGYASFEILNASLTVDPNHPNFNIVVG